MRVLGGWSGLVAGVAPELHRDRCDICAASVRRLRVGGCVPACRTVIGGDVGGRVGVCVGGGWSLLRL